MYFTIIFLTKFIASQICFERTFLITIIIIIIIIVIVIIMKIIIIIIITTIKNRKLIGLYIYRIYIGLKFDFFIKLYGWRNSTMKNIQYSILYTIQLSRVVFRGDVEC